MGNLVYNVTDYQKYLWKYRKMVDSTVEQAELEGKKQYEAFPSFASEVFHRLYAEQPEKLVEPASGSEPFQKMHSEMDKIPELADLSERCRGDENWSGIGTSAILDTLLSTVDRQENQVQDPTEDLETLESMKKLLERAPEGREDIEEAIQELQEGISDKLQAAQAASNLLDDSKVRQAIRVACAAAQKEISAQESAFEAFGAGTQQHSKQGRKQACKEVSEALANNSRLRQIAELAGRLRRIAAEKQRQKPRKGTDEITGIELGDSLSRLVPVEALSLDSEMEVIFARKFMEKTLQQFELNQTPPKEQGPVVVLLDSSGSMKTNSADVWAAAVALALFEVARKQKRAFALLHFGNTILRTDVWEADSKVGVKELMGSVGFFASAGGTDFEDPLDSAVAVIKSNKNFKDADVIMITDGQSSVSDGWLAKFNSSKSELGFKVQTILIKGREDVAKKFSNEVVQLEDVLHNDERMHEVFSRI